MANHYDYAIGASPPAMRRLTVPAKQAISSNMQEKATLVQESFSSSTGTVKQIAIVAGGVVVLGALVLMLTKGKRK